MSTPLPSTSSRNRGRSPWRSLASVHRYKPGGGQPVAQVIVWAVLVCRHSSEG